MTPAELARRKALSDADRRARQAAADAAADGGDRHRRRLPLLAARRGRRHHQLPEVPNPAAVPAAASCHTGPGRYEVPPSYFLIRGDLESRGSLMKPGLHRRHHVRQSADRDSAGRRPHVGPPARAGRVDCVAAEPADRARDRQSPLAEAFRPRHRRDARELRQDGRAADPSGAARLAGRRVHEPRLEHQADQQADDDVGGLPDGVALRGCRRREERSGEPLPVAVPPAAARRRDRARQHARASGGNINLEVGGEPIFPFMPKDILAGSSTAASGRTRRTVPAAWRRGVYVYRRRSLPYPMFDMFDHPDMNVTAGARNVSTVPTQALTLLNNPFVLSQAKLLADRVSRGGQRSRRAGRPGVSDRAGAAGHRGRSQRRRGSDHANSRWWRSRTSS